MKSNRRGFIKLSGMTGIGLAGATILPDFSRELEARSESAVQPQSSSQYVPLNRFPEVMQEYLVKQLRQIEQVSPASLMCPIMRLKAKRSLYK